MARTKNGSKPQKNARRGRQSKFEDDQREFLEGFVPAYVSVGHGRPKGDELWNQIFPGFFTRWPIDTSGVDLSGCKTDAEREKVIAAYVAKMKNAIIARIKGWFTRHTAVKQSRRSVWQQIVARAIQPKKGVPRRWTEKTIYKFYMAMDEHKEKVSTRACEEAGDRDLGRDEVLPHWLKVAKELWATEPESVREDVRRTAAESYEQRLAAYKTTSLEGELSVEQRNELRTHMVSAMQPWMEEVIRVTKGTTALLIIGIPPSEDSPKVKTMSVEVGHTTARLGLKTYKQRDPVRRQAFVRSFADFTIDTVDRSPVGAVQDEAQQARLEGGDPLRGMLTFDGDTYEFDVARAEGAGRGDEAVDAASTRAPPLVTAEAAPSSTSAEASGSHADPSTTEAPSTRSTHAAHAAATATTQAESRSSSPLASTSTAPSPVAPSASAAPRLRPKPVRYDVPETFSGYVAKDVALNSSFRALLQRMPKTKRDGKLSTMMRWHAADFKKANKLAEENAALGAPTVARDAGILKELFKHWEREAPKATEHKEPTPEPAPSKRKRRTEEGDDDEYETEGEGDNGPPVPRRRSARNKHKQATSTTGSTQGATDSRRLGASAAAPRAAPAAAEKETDPACGATPLNGDDRAGTSTRNGGSEPGEATPTAAAPAMPRDELRADRSGALSETRENRGTDSGALSMTRENHDTDSGATSETRENRDAESAPRKDVELGHQASQDVVAQNDESTAPNNGNDAPRPSAQGESTPPPSLFDPEKLGDLASWMVNAYHNVDELEEVEGFEAGHRAYHDAVRLWAEIEGTNDFKESGRGLPSLDERPSQVAAWIKRKRVATYRPDLLLDKPLRTPDNDFACATFDQFCVDMKRWWHALNPPWRTRTNAFALSRDDDDGDWSALYCVGQNGLISLIVCLKWWWEMLDDEDVEEQEGDREEWCEAVEDVAWVLEKVLKQYRSGTIDLETAGRPSKRQRMK